MSYPRLSVLTACAIAILALISPQVNRAQEEKPAKQAKPAPPPPPNCKSVCYTYTELVKAERANAIASGYQYYLVTATDVLLTLKVRPDLISLPPVDDILYVQDNGADLWRYLYPRTDAATFSLAVSQLPPGPNLVQLWYEDLYPPNAHFFADVCGLGYPCQTYKEGLAFGTGIVNRVRTPPYPNNLMRTVVRQLMAWRSKIDDPKPLTGCSCKIPTEEEQISVYQKSVMQYEESMKEMQKSMKESEDPASEKSPH